jgi:hypothetical protein
MGNRGILHDESKRIVAPWRVKRWIICTLSFKGRHRSVFAPRRYSELFFLDEATAFAAGHRPCAECRRDRFNEFRAVWMVANADRMHVKSSSVDEIDKVLHAERAVRGGGKRTYRANLQALPAGAMVEYSNSPHLIWHGGLRPWSFRGYGEPIQASPGAGEVAVLTPRSIVRVFELGFRPQVHEQSR